ncbi:MAG: hypothetical protein LBT68_05040 [Spirochaetales bacterium]|jgi:hypothetical protein|nr:hypothetical protein [Spirochaetales bacterium]
MIFFNPLRKLNKIRREIYKEIKNMTPEERIKYFNEKAREVNERQGLKTKIVDHV